VRPQDLGALRCQVIEMVLATDMTKVRPAARRGHRFSRVFKRF
jgi:hypothetical protein